MDSKFTTAGKVLALKSDMKKLGLNFVGDTEPTTPEEGQSWYESDINAIGWYTGTVWNSNIKVNNLVDVNGLELLKFTATGSAVNELTIKNNSTGNDPEIQATGETNIGLNIVTNGTGIIKIDSANIISGLAGYRQGIITYKDNDELYIKGNILGVKDKLAFWTSQLTYDVGDPDPISTWYYVYLDYSAITKGTAITTSEIINNTTAPSWDHQYRGWYNGDDRCIGCFYANGTSDVQPFYWNMHSGKYSYVIPQNEINSGTGSTNVTLGFVPNFGEMDVILWCYLDGASGGVNSNAIIYLAPRGSSDTSFRVGIESAIAGGNTIAINNYVQVTMTTDSSQGILYAIEGSSQDAVDIDVQGFYLSI